MNLRHFSGRITNAETAPQPYKSVLSLEEVKAEVARLEAGEPLLYDQGQYASTFWHWLFDYQQEQQHTGSRNPQTCPQCRPLVFKVLYGMGDEDTDEQL